ncbi:hypothetical protein Ciccas_006922 [Cichlidogyrus casuarinus]|uniref:Uncharacterized protein n=1 Tax=Cichlidogyrus casuarinus TaxID=1844966 RepID=A0ABD2Q4C2_9PLAT
MQLFVVLSVLLCAFSSDYGVTCSNLNNGWKEGLNLEMRRSFNIACFVECKKKGGDCIGCCNKCSSNPQQSIAAYCSSAL